MSDRFSLSTVKTLLVIGIVLIPPAASIILSFSFGWKFHTTYAVVQLIMMILIPLLIPFAILLGRKLAPFKWLIFLWLASQIITIISVYWQYRIYTRDPELFSITEEIHASAKKIKERDTQEILKSLAEQNIALKNDLRWLTLLRIKIASNQKLYDAIMDGSGVLPADSNLIIFERVFMPPGSDPDHLFQIKIYSTSTNILKKSIYIPGHDYTSSIDAKIAEINKKLTENNLFAKNARVNNERMDFFRFLHFSRKGDIRTQSVVFQIVETLNEPISWIVLTLIANNLVFFKRRDRNDFI